MLRCVTIGGDVGLSGASVAAGLSWEGGSSGRGRVCSWWGGLLGSVCGSSAHSGGTAGTAEGQEALTPTLGGPGTAGSSSVLSNGNSTYF